MDQLTEKQRKAVDELKKEAGKTGLRIGAIGGLRLAAMCAAVIVVNQLTIQSDMFVMLMAFVSGVSAMSITRNEMKEEQEKLHAQVQNILENP